ncbi:MAG: tRNA (guanosine(37)-N1)-methyltransferase TrmD [Microscillaceae bacterium]|nr:tRNA (guanosine(37)-N1)-methyltransferase TrmD [Microscillaceae bacterium]MDW8460128.1 tRNA (guanosine(37)-N1)-methyltransferase TrmD [Cytophagales bacterium]
MRIDIISAVPQLLESPFAHSIMKRAIDKGLVKVVFHNLHDYATNKYKQIDDYVFGGGAGLVLMIEPIFRCIEKLKAERNYDAIIFLTPDGELFDQKKANQFSLLQNIILLCGHYKGIDERVRQHLVTHEWSIGDYVISGGELAACVVADAIIRLIPGVLNDETSALSDSFQDGLLSPPVYTRPRNFQGWEVPEVLLSGNHAEIDKWRYEQALKRTQTRRPDLLSKRKG